jgi:hypothetical protein
MLLETTCRSVEWDRDNSSPAEERLAGALKRHRLELSVDGVELRAWVTDEVGLAVSVRVTRGWNSVVEKSLYDALDRDRSVVAGLLLWEWAELRAACSAAASGVDPGTEVAKPLEN